jgi:predicted pyridoxine 5'-phosphate oxidase superfamily flavin-nucleotide-binding protein
MGIEDLSITTSQGLGGISRQADIAFRLRLEPRFDAGLIGSASVAWTTLAGQSDGRPLVVDDAAASDTDDDLRQRLRRRMRLVRFGRRMVQVPVKPSACGGG